MVLGCSCMLTLAGTLQSTINKSRNVNDFSDIQCNRTFYESSNTCILMPQYNINGILYDIYLSYNGMLCSIVEDCLPKNDNKNIQITNCVFDKINNICMKDLTNISVYDDSYVKISIVAWTLTGLMWISLLISIYFSYKRYVRG